MSRRGPRLVKLRQKRKTIPLARANCKWPRRVASPAVRSAVSYCRLHRLRNARSVDSSYTPAGNARISILPSASNVCSQFPNALHEKMNATPARSIQSASDLKRKHRHPLPPNPATRGRHLRIFSRKISGCPGPGIHGKPCHAVRSVAESLPRAGTSESNGDLVEATKNRR